MITSQAVQNSINDLKEITKVDIMVIHTDLTIFASTWEEEALPVEILKQFIHSPVEGQQALGYYFYKVYDEEQLSYVVLTRSSQEDAYTVGKIAVSQLTHLLKAYREKKDKNNFIRSLLTDNLMSGDIYDRARQLHIRMEAQRVLYMIEVSFEQSDLVLELVKNLFSQRYYFAMQMDERNILLIRELKEEDTKEDIVRTAHVLVDMLNAEAMAKVRVSYGTVVSEFVQLPKSYREAKMALEVGSIFYKEKIIIPYEMLGIGRLIYQLPIPLCKLFLEEVFGKKKPEELDEETLATIQKFFEMNLNVSETARQLFVHRNTLNYRLEKIEKITGLDIKTFDDAMTLKVALMVEAYLQQIEET